MIVYKTCPVLAQGFVALLGRNADAVLRVRANYLFETPDLYRKSSGSDDLQCTSR